MGLTTQGAPNVIGGREQVARTAMHHCLASSNDKQSVKQLPPILIDTKIALGKNADSDEWNSQLFWRFGHIPSSRRKRKRNDETLEERRETYTDGSLTAS